MFMYIKTYRDLKAYGFFINMTFIFIMFIWPKWDLEILRKRDAFNISRALWGI
ncbi:MAG: hypothetical protein Q7U35_04680 [Methanobacteriaceae archaeon]|nr:hypothetical protein [Methanobacteriaceae archaeon]